MSAGAITGTASTKDVSASNEILELTGGEDPAKFLDMNGLTILGLIARMSDPDRIEGWRQAEEEHTKQDRDVVFEALDRQEAALEDGQTPPIYHPIHDRYDPDTDPLLDDTGDEGANTEATEESNPESGHEPHPEANLETGEVLVVKREETTEYIWPAQADADTPYICREMNGTDERQQQGLSADGAFDRLGYDPDKRSIDSVAVDAPLEAATNRGESA